MSVIIQTEEKMASSAVKNDAKLFLKVGCGVVIAIVVLLIIGSLFVTPLQTHRRKKYIATMQRMERVGDALTAYRERQGHYPASESAAELSKTLGLTDTQLTHDEWGRELRYESRGCNECGFFLASAGYSGEYERARLDAYPSGAVMEQVHPNVVYSDKGWIQYPEASLQQGKVTP